MATLESDQSGTWDLRKAAKNRLFHHLENCEVLGLLRSKIDVTMSAKTQVMRKRKGLRQE